MEGRERAQNKEAQLEFYYTCIYDLLRKPNNFLDLHVKLKYYKAKIIQLHSNQMQHLQAELRGNITVPAEQPSLYHIITRQQLRKKNFITEITDRSNVRQTQKPNIRKTFYTELHARFAHIPIHKNSQEQIHSVIAPTIEAETQELINGQITSHELQVAIMQAPKTKSPGRPCHGSGG
jgi:hypothetical protein